MRRARWGWAVALLALLLAALDGFPLQPAFLRAHLRRLPSHLEHIVNVDAE